MHLVFVYGTLKAGHGNHRLLERAERIGDRWLTAADFVLYDLGSFPGLVETDVEGGEPVTGELYRVDDATLASLDGLEGHPFLYRREWIAVQPEAGGAIKPVYAYIYQRSVGGYGRVEGGEWLGRRVSEKWI
jgi:gamma-glutamylcyclotransferase (GGCT)/AIG2-like uncharacterized protein YtfP